MAIVAGNFFLTNTTLTLSVAEITSRSISTINTFLITDSVVTQDEIGQGLAPRANASNTNFNWGH